MLCPLSVSFFKGICGRMLSVEQYLRTSACRSCFCIKTVSREVNDLFGGKSALS
jgi:hypothetical protein